MPLTQRSPTRRNNYLPSHANPRSSVGNACWAANLKRAFAVASSDYYYFECHRFVIHSAFAESFLLVVDPTDSHLADPVALAIPGSQPQPQPQDPGHPARASSFPRCFQRGRHDVN